MFQSKIVENFIRNKLQEKLNSFFQLQKSTIDGLTIRNIVMKPDLLKQLSQIIKIPLILKSGQIQSVSLNIPWDNLFSAKKDQSISVVISGVKINAKLPNYLQREYVILRKKKIVEKFTQEFNKKATSRLTFINKLKQYFFGTFCVQLKSLELQFNLDLKHSLIGILTVSNLKFQKDMVKNKTKFQIKDLSLGYKFSKQIKQQYIINKADLTMKGQKHQGVEIDHFQTKRLQISFNNQNFNDVRRLIALIKWHNSFVDIPEKLWQNKPFIIGQIKPIIKLRYVSQIILYKIRERRPKHILNILKTRRQYIRLFEQFRRNPSNQKAKYELNQFQQRIDIWRVKQYRKFCLLWEQNYPNDPHIILKRVKNGKKQVEQKKKINWLSYWFPKNQQTQLKQLETYLNNTPVNFNRKQFTFSIQSIKIALSIHSLVGKQPFVNLISLNNQIYSLSVPLTKKTKGVLESDIQYQKNTKISVQKMFIQYDKYQGHHDDHKYLMCESVGSVLQENEDDQFNDIQNFLEWEISKDKSEVKLMPISVRINQDTVQKFSVFKLQRIHNTFQSAETLVLEQNAFEINTLQKENKLFNVVTNLRVILPQNMCQKQCQQLQMSLIELKFTEFGTKHELNVKQISFSASLYAPRSQQKTKIDQSSRKMDQSIQIYHHLARPEKFQIFSTSLRMKKQIHQSLQQTYITITPIKVTLFSMSELKQLIRLVSKIKPKKKQKIPLYKLKNLRRKQSIGEQFIDACQNLQQHLIRSKTFSQKTKYQKYIVKDKKDKKFQLELQGLKIIFQHIQIQLTRTTATIFEFSDYKSISIDKQDKQLTINVYNIGNLNKNLTQISNQLIRSLELSGKKQNINKKINESQFQGDQLEMNNLNISINIFYNKKLKIIGQINNISLQISREQNVKAQASFGLAFNIYKRLNVPPLKEYTVQPFKLIYNHQKGYNKDEKVIKISDIVVNIKPNLFIELGSMFDELCSQEKTRIQIQNLTSNNINISTTGNIYKEYGPGVTVVSQSTKCDIILFAKKQSLSLLQQSGNQKIKITQHLSLLKTMKTQYKYYLQSNFRITNRQENTIWVRVITNKGMMEIKKKFTKQTGIVTFEHLSSAGLDFSSLNNIQGRRSPNLKRSSSLNQRNIEYERQHDDSIDQQLDKEFIGIKKATIKTNFVGVSPKNSNNLPYIKHGDPFQHQLQQITLKNRRVGSQRSNNSQNQNSSNEIKTITNKTSKKLSNGHKIYQSSVRRHEVFLQQIHPQQTIQILLSSQDYYIQFIEYNKKGQIIEKYSPFKVKQVFKDGNQRIIHSYQYDSFNHIDQKQISSTLVAVTTVKNLQKQPLFPVYQIQLLSPVAVVNKMPVHMQFRFNKQQVDILEVIQSGGKQIRKKSFQATELEKVQPFKINRINKMIYKQISQTEIYIKDYYKKFRLDHTIENLSNTTEQIDIRIFDLLCLNNGAHEIQMGIQIRILNSLMKITIFPQFIFVNMTSLDMKLQIRQENYNYPIISVKPAHQNIYYKSFIRMSSQRLSHHKVLQQLFHQFQQNINVFTGSFQQNTRRYVKYNNQGNFSQSSIYQTYEYKQNEKNRQEIISYDNRSNKIVVRKIKIDDKPINLVFYMPSLLIINKSDWSFFIKGSGEKPKKLVKHSIEYLLINDGVVIQACEQHEDISYNQWMKITLNTLGIIFYAKEMTSSNGYQSRQYQLRKKRLKKVPKIFFRIVLTKYEYGHQILIQQSQYPPVSFISRCKARTQIKQSTQNIIQQMQMNQVAEYASKIPHHMPKFQLSMVENYQFKMLGHFTLDSPSVKIFQNCIRVTVQQYKDKKIIILEDYKEQDLRNVSTIRNQLLLQKLERVRFIVNNIQFSVLNNFNKQLTCTCIKGIQVSHQSKNTKKYVKLTVNDILILSYNGLQPRYLFYSKQPINKNIISKKQVLGFFKGKKNISAQITQSFIINNPILNSSITSRISAQSNISMGASSSHQILILDLVIDYHKHATILEKCTVTISEIVIVINANTIIDYLKYYQAQMLQMYNMITKHQMGRSIIKQISQALSGTPQNQSEKNNNENNEDIKHSLRRNSISINNINQNMIKKTQQNQQSPKKVRKLNSESHNISHPPNNDNVDILNRGFVIENFMWNGLKVTIKFQNIQNFQYFLKKSQMKLKYLFKFINWIGDLRPLSFSPTEVQYQQYTIMKLLGLIDLNKLMGQLYQNFLEYPLQELNHILSFLTRIIGCNDMEDHSQQWNTLNRLGKSLYRFSKRLLSYNSPSTTYIVTKEGELKQNKKYLQKFMQDCNEQDSFMTRIMKFRYQQWRYKEQGKQNKLNQKITRLQRYNRSNELLPYDELKARIQTAINDICGNKFFRELTRIQIVNKNTIIGITDDWFVLYMIDKQQWVVAKPEQVLELRLQKIKQSNKNNKNLFAPNSISKQLVVCLATQNEGNDRNFRISKYTFSGVTLTQVQVQEILQYLNQLKLSNVY